MNLLDQITPYLAAAGNELINLDDDKTGADDFAGELLVYTAEVNAAIKNGEDLPSFPAALANGVAGKITGVSKVTLRVLSSALTIAQFQLSGKAAMAIRYINQALRNLLAGSDVPPPPSLLVGS